MYTENVMYDMLSIENTNQATRKPKSGPHVWTQDIFVIQKTAFPTEVVQARTRVKSDLTVAEKELKHAVIPDSEWNETLSPSSFSILGSKKENLTKNSNSISFMTVVDSRSSKPNRSTAGVPYRTNLLPRTVQKSPAQIYREEMKRTLLKLDKAEADKTKLFNNSITSIPETYKQKSNELKERILQLRESYTKKGTPSELFRTRSILSHPRVISR